MDAVVTPLRLGLGLGLCIGLTLVLTVNELMSEVWEVLP